MKKYIVILIALICASDIYSRTISLSSIPTNPLPGANMLIMQSSGKDLKYRLDSIKLDGVKSPQILIDKKDDLLSIKLPNNISIGSHKLSIFLNNVIGEELIDGELIFNVIENKEKTEEYPKGSDPNPNTQMDKPKDLGQNPQPVRHNEIINNPSGGWGNAGFDCSILHEIDGKFTDTLANKSKEWSGIAALSGRFSNLYLDYCNSKGVLYLLNDWYNGTGKYDSNSCYNRFEFKTGNGYESWVIKVFHSTVKPIEVILNGKDVTNDTNIVIGGMFGEGKSPLVDSNHTIYEFGVKASSGLFIMEQQHDPYSPPEGPTITVICDKNGQVGYGLVGEPSRTVGNLGSGFSGKREGRYIPMEGVAGLEVEPNTIGGVIKTDAISVGIASSNGEFTPCDKNHKVDGNFTDETNFKEEWLKAKPAVGKFSNLYADFCTGWLYVLNDWKLANKEPDSKNCYNLFELFTANGTEHWGVFVYQDPNRKTKVFRNGIDVSADTNIVKPGAYGFSKSPLDTNAHAIYEFAIKAGEGSWALYMADPGPASFCDENTDPSPRLFSPGIGIRKDDCNVCGYPGEHMSLILANPGDTLGLTFGTNTNSQSWWCRNFTVEIPFDANEFTPLAVKKLAKNQISIEKVNFQIKSDTQNNKVISIVANNNDYLQNPGDLFTLEGIVKFKSVSSISVSPKIQVSNATSVLRYADLPTTLIEKKTSGVNIKSNEYCSVYPNPISEFSGFKIEVNGIFKSSVNLRIIDVTGATVFTKNNIELQNGKNTIEINNSNLPSGSYFINIYNFDEYRNIPVTVVK